MQFEEFDNRVREAAENHHPAYDEKAWAGMEKLLNKHLPQENDGRRRFIFFIFLFLLLGAGSVWLFSSKPLRENKQVTAANTTVKKSSGNIPAIVSAVQDNSEKDKNKPGVEENTDLPVAGNSRTNSANLPAAPMVPSLNTHRTIDGQNFVSSSNLINKKKQKKQEPAQDLKNDRSMTGENLENDRLKNNQAETVSTKTTAASFIPDQKEKNKEAATLNDQTTSAPVKPGLTSLPGKENINKGNVSLVQDPNQKKEKNKSKKRNTFFFTLSAGPDISATGGDKLGKTKLLTGGGLGFTFKDRITIRSGFYTGRKIYTASPGSYHPPANFWNYYPNLQKVDADCKVYEIPLSLSYQFGHSSKQNWFASAGISSYLMKKETYNYFYKYTAAGPTVQKKWTTQDENKHYFSVLTLSGGYQRNIGKNLSITAEPYFKMPLSGVGFGKVKLNSGGLLLTVAIKPFAGSGKTKK